MLSTDKVHLKILYHYKINQLPFADMNENHLPEDKLSKCHLKLRFVKMAIGGPLKAVIRLIDKLLKQGGTYISDQGFSFAFGGIDSLYQTIYPDGVNISLKYILWLIIL